MRATRGDGTKDRAQALSRARRSCHHNRDSRRTLPQSTDSGHPCRCFRSHRASLESIHYSPLAPAQTTCISLPPSDLFLSLTWHDKGTGHEGQQEQGARRLSEGRHAAAWGEKEMCLCGMVGGRVREGGRMRNQNRRSMLPMVSWVWQRLARATTSAAGCPTTCLPFVHVERVAV